MKAKAGHKPRTVPDRVKAETDEPFLYCHLSDEDFTRQNRIDIVRAESVLSALARRGDVERVELEELLHLLLFNLYGWQEGVARSPEEQKFWDAKRDEAAIAACAHWPENLRHETAVMLQFAA